MCWLYWDSPSQVRSRGLIQLYLLFADDARLLHCLFWRSGVLVSPLFFCVALIPILDRSRLLPAVLSVTQNLRSLFIAVRACCVQSPSVSSLSCRVFWVF